MAPIRTGSGTRIGTALADGAGERRRRGHVGTLGARLAMNARADHLVVALRTALAALPGATAISIHVTTSWTLVMITAESDEAVNSLAKALGLTSAAA